MIIYAIGVIDSVVTIYKSCFQADMSVMGC